jgi:hypothetical protein
VEIPPEVFYEKAKNFASANNKDFWGIGGYPSYDGFLAGGKKCSHRYAQRLGR